MPEVVGFKQIIELYRRRGNCCGHLLHAAEVLIDGCKDHPSYRCKRKPTGGCWRCGQMWAARQVINEASELLALRK